MSFWTGLLLSFLFIGLSYAKDYYCVQLASSKDLEALKELFKKVLYLPDLRIEKVGEYYTLRAGLFNNRKGAERVLNRGRLAFSDAFVRTCALKPERIVVPKPRKRTRAFTYEVGMKLASLYIKRKEFSKAERIYRELSELHPDSKEVKLQLARVLYWQGKYEEALKIYRELEIFNPKIANERRKVEISRTMKLVEELEREGKLKEAIELLEKLYEEEKTNYDVGMKLGKLYIRTGQRRRANRVFSQLMSKYTEDKEIRRLYEITRARRIVKKNQGRSLSQIYLLTETT